MALDVSCSTFDEILFVHIASSGRIKLNFILLEPYKLNETNQNKFSLYVRTRNMFTPVNSLCILIFRRGDDFFLYTY